MNISLCKMNCGNYPPKRGVTLVEALMVIGVLAILLGLAMLVAILVRSSQLVSQTAIEVATIVDASNKMTVDNPRMNGFSAKALAGSGFLSTRWTSGDKIISPYGTEVEVWPDNDESYGSALIDIQLYRLPLNACVRLPSMLAGQAISVKINGTTITDENQKAVDPKVVVGACYRNGNYMDFIF